MLVIKFGLWISMIVRNVRFCLFFFFVCVCVRCCSFSFFFFFVWTRLTECHAVGKQEYREIITHYGPDSCDMLTA